MKYYNISGYIMPKGQEDKGWQKMTDGIQIKLLDDMNPYEELNKEFSSVASHWLYTVDEIRSDNT